MATSTRIREHLRHNVVGYIALFCFAIGGAAQALPGKNQVDSGDIKKAQVKNSDLANGAVIESKLADGAVTNAKLAQDAVDGAKVANDSLKGTDVDEASLNIPQQAIPSSLPPSGAAGGDLSGTYPDPQVQEAGLVPGGDLSGTVANAQVGEAGLVPGGDLGGTLANAQVSEAGLTAAGDITGALNATSIANNSLGALEPGVANDEILDGGVDTDDVQNNNLTATDIANTDTIADQELDNTTRSILVPASELNAASVAGEAPTNDAEFGFTPTSKAAAVTFDPNTLEAVNLVTEVPSNRVAGTNMSVRVHWDSTVVGVVDWRVDVLSRGFNDPSNVAPTQGIAQLDIYANANTVHNFSLNIPAASIETGDMLYIRVVRVANSADDTLAADANVHLFEIEYSAER